MTRTQLGAADLLLMAVGVAGVSMSGPLIALTAAPALAIAFWRTALAVAAITPFALGRHRSALASVRRDDLRLTLLAGAALAVHFAAWVSSLKLTSVASSTALVCLQAGWVVLFAWLAGGRLDRRTTLGLLTCLVGVLVVTGVDFTISRTALLGDLLALFGGVMGAVYMVVGGRVRQRTDTTVYTLYCYGTCAGLLLVSCLLTGQRLVGYAAADWALLVALAVLSQLLGHSVFNHLLARVSPTVVSLVILLEVPGASLLAGWLLGQVPPAGVYVGLALLLAGLAVVVVVRRDAPAEAPPD